MTFKFLTIRLISAMLQWRSAELLSTLVVEWVTLWVLL